MNDDFQYNIANFSDGLVVMFKVSWLDPHGDMESNIDILFGESETGGNDWFLYELSCGNPNSDEVNDMLMAITQYLRKHDIDSVESLITFCKAIGTENKEIFSYGYSRGELDDPHV